jgi:general stress protein 26
MDQDQIVKDYFQAQELAVVTTLNRQGQPQSALVGVSKHADFKLVFGTQEHTRKFQNLLDNQTMAVVIGLAKPATIQMEGEARILKGDERAKYEPEHLIQRPGSKAFSNLPGLSYILFTPKWLRYTDITKKPELIIERNL